MNRPPFSERPHAPPARSWGAAPEASHDDGAVALSSPLVRQRDRAGRVFFSGAAPPPPTGPVRRPAKLAITLAIARYLDAQLAHRQVHDRAELAKLLGLSRARITQILDLVLLDPRIQEEVLFAEAIDGVEPPFTQATARRVALIPLWSEQRAAWEKAKRQPQETP